MNAAQQIAAQIEFNSLERACAANARAVESVLRRFADGEDGAAIDAEYDALFWEGERLSARMLELEPLVARPVAIAA